MMGEGDRYTGVLCSSPVCCGHRRKVTVLWIYLFIRKADGSNLICNVPRACDAEGHIIGKVDWDKIDNHAEEGVEREQDREVEWHFLDLSGVTNMQEQIEKMDAWGRIGKYADNIAREMRDAHKSP